MKRKALLLAVLCLGSAAFGAAQETEKHEPGDKPAASAPHKDKTPTPLRVQIVFNEFDGEKKINSLPYTLLVNADVGGPLASIRMGLRVPVRTSASTFTYVDMGTNVDGRAEKQDDGRFSLSLSVERSSAYPPQVANFAGNSDSKSNPTRDNSVTSESPVIQQFRSQINVLMRDGQTQQTTLSTDPVTGHVIKVDVTLTVLK